jgi:acyl carrier protein
MTDQRTDIDRATRFAEIRDIACETFSVGPEEVETATSFQADLGVDSIDGIELLTRLEEHFAITLNENTVPLLMTDLSTVYEVVAENGGW